MSIAVKERYVPREVLEEIGYAGMSISVRWTKIGHKYNNRGRTYYRWVGIDKNGIYWVAPDGDNNEPDFSDPTIIWSADCIEVIFTEDIVAIRQHIDRTWLPCKHQYICSINDW